MFRSLGQRVSEPQTKFVSLILLALGGLASVAGSEAVLPAYLVGMALAPTFLAEHELPHRMRIIAFSILINDLGTVLALGVVFAHYDLWLLMFSAVTRSKGKCRRFAPAAMPNRRRNARRRAPRDTAQRSPWQFALTYILRLRSCNSERG